MNFVLDSSLGDLHAAYKKAALKCHPDVGGNPEEFIALTESYKSAQTKLHKSYPPDYWVQQGALFTSVIITVWQAILGTEITLRSGCGVVTHVTIPPKTSHLSVLKVPGAGLYNTKTSSYDDLHLAVLVCYPNLTEEQIAAISSWL